MIQKQRKRVFATLLAIVLIVSGLGIHIPVYAQNTSNPNLTTVSDNSDTTAMKLAKLLVGDDIEIKSARMLGDQRAFGSFTGAYDLVGFDKGLILGTGDVTDTFKHGYETGSSHDLSGSKLLEITSDELKGFSAVDGDTYYDAAILEFTIIPNTNKLSFQYAVASDEYLHWISNYWDKFVLTVNGVNYAKIPTTNQDVTIGTININHNSEYYRGIQVDGKDDDNAISLDQFIYNGITKVFSVDAPVNKGEENVIRMAIADYNDAVLDSAVFIKADSVKSKQALYGLIEISYIDSETKELYIRRKGGYVGAVSADLVYYSASGNQIAVKTVEFPDGAYINKVEAPAGAAYVALANPTGAVKLASEEKVAIDTWVSAEALKEMKTKVSGTVYEMKDGNKVPAANATVELKTMDGKINTSVTTDAQGNYTIYNVPGGKHNLSITNAEASKSEITYIDLNIYDITPTGKILEDTILKNQVSIDIEAGAQPVVINGLDTVASADSSIIANVSAVKLADSPNKDIINEGVEQTAAKLEYILDINLTVDGQKKTELTKPIYITVKIPDNLKGKGDYYLYHVHNDGQEVEILYDLDNDPDTITVAISKFSEFALLYTTDTSDIFESTESKDLINQMNQLNQSAIEEAKKQEVVTPTAKPTQEPSVTVTPTVKPTQTPNVTATPTVKPTQEPTVTVTPTAKPTQEPSVTVTPTVKPTQTPNVTATPTAKPTELPNVTTTPSSTVVPTATPIPEVDFNGISVIAKKTIYVGQNYEIKISGLKDDAIAKYKSSKKTVATVNVNGNVLGRKAGKTTITTTVVIDNQTKKFKTVITVKPKSITLTQVKKTVKIGDSYTYKAKAYGTNSKIVWSVSDKKIATINKTTGKLTAKKEGTVTIYATSGSVKKSYKVNIKK